MVLQKSGFDVLKGGSNPFHDGNKIIVWTKKNIEEKPKTFYAVSEKQNPPKMSQSF